MSNDFLENLGPAAISQILRRLQEKLTAQNQRRFHEMGVPIPPVAVSTLLTLFHLGPQSVSEIAERLQLSHPRVLKFVAMLETPRLVSIEADPDDGRRKIIKLTASGTRLAENLEEDRQRLNEVMRALFAEIEIDLVEAAFAASAALDRQSLSERMNPASETASRSAS